MPEDIVININSGSELPQDDISWFIDRIGDNSIINRERIINYNNYSNNYSNNYLLDTETFSYIQNDYIFNNIQHDGIISNVIINYIEGHDDYIITQAIPLLIILDESVEFSEEQCDCCICMDIKNPTNICQLNCGHTFCVECIDSSIKTFKSRLQNNSCSLCRANIEKITVKIQENKDKIQQCL